MTKYREIIRLTGLGFSQRNIMASCGVSQKTVVKCIFHLSSALFPGIQST